MFRFDEFAQAVDLIDNYFIMIFCNVMQFFPLFTRAKSGKESVGTQELVLFASFQR